MLASLFLIGATLVPPQMTVQAANQTLVDESGGTGAAVNRMLGGIIGYARWPDGQRGGTRTMCLVGTPRTTDRIAPVVPGGPAVIVRRTTAAVVTGQSGDCDIVFLARMPIADRRRLVGWARGRPVLTITDDDPGCLYGAMFCLARSASNVSFSVDLDAVGRGTLRIDPRVLKIGRDGGTP
ncbi:MAG: DUF4154 domain-containing protein [Sphingopyxis sp.]|nr:DUF4154 domain-containing protein [Sphingopyxis sp.]